MKSTLTIGILETGIIDDHLIAIHGTYPQMFVDMFTQYNNLDTTLDFRFYQVIEDHYPQDINECDVYLITGSKCDSFAKDPWILKLKDYIKTLYQQQIPLVGICFGHQLIALALGGEAKRSNKGWGVGAYTSKITEPCKSLNWLQPKQTDFNLLVSHQDQVSELPPQAKLLASNDFCQNSAYYINNQVICFQGHPEISPEFARGLMKLRKEVIPEDVYNQGLESSKGNIDADIVTQWILRFVNKALRDK